MKSPGKILFAGAFLCLTVMDNVIKLREWWKVAPEVQRFVGIKQMNLVCQRYTTPVFRTCGTVVLEMYIATNLCSPSGGIFPAIINPKHHSEM
jgi:hypothetical protein